VEPDADELAALVDERTDVGILAVAAPLQELDGDLDQTLRRVRQVQAHDAAGLVEPAVVLDEVQAEELLPIGVPVGPDPLEHTGPVVERVRQDAHLRVLERNELSVEERPRGLRRRTTPQRRPRPGQLLHHGLPLSVRCTVHRKR